MNVALSERAIAALAGAVPAVQRSFIKQMNFLAHLPDFCHTRISFRGALKSHYDLEHTSPKCAPTPPVPLGQSSPAAAARYHQK